VKLLWTISNWKQTGPLEPSLDLAAAVRAAGHEVDLLVGRPPPGSRAEAHDCARARGLTPLEVGATLSKHAAPLRDWRDARRLQRQVAAGAYDAVVTTQRNDHRLALRAARGRGLPVTRLLFHDGRAPLERRDLAACVASDLVFVFTGAAREQLRAAGVAADRVVLTGPPLDLAALRQRVPAGEDARARYGVGPASFLFGIVARMQTHRRFEILWDAVAMLEGRGVPFHLLAIGRGTNADLVAREPVARRGLGDRVTFTGYLRGEAYAAAVAALQAQLFLVPGSDPTCRALREGMGLGVASIATRRGMLPDLVEDGVTGLLVDEDGAALAGAMEALARAPEETARMGEAARLRAEERFDAPRVAADVLAALRRAGAGAGP
jgi:glycosyltransferase involved in cell wall biosynthesis